MASIIDIIKEETRQAAMGDDRYKSKGNHVFVLVGPPNEGPLSYLGRAQFPLVINPETFNFRAPFAAEITPLQEQGVVSEEGGIVIGELQLGGTFGFKLRDNLGEFSTGRGGGDFGSGIDDGRFLMTGTGGILGGVSAHMHFWRLFSRCFDGYSALKKDPKTASQTFMEYHNVKDELHYTIVPREFTVERSAAKERVTYRYNIRAAVVGPAEDQLYIPSPDTDLLTAIKNTISTIRKTIQGISAAIDDVTAAIDEIRRSITSIASIIDDVAGIVDSFTELVNGITAFVDIPKAFITATAGLIESAADFATTVTSFPADVAQSFRDIGDGLDALAVAARDHFREGMTETARKYQRLTEGYQSGRYPQRDSAAADLKDKADEGQGRLTVNEAFGGSVRPGDTLRGRIDPGGKLSRLRPGAFKGYEERVIGDGDTIQGLAARYMGNARDWPAIAMANQLQPPYIASAKLPGTLQVGSRVIIPTRHSVSNPDTLTTGNVNTGDSQIEALLGRDLELVQLDNGTFDLAIDAAGGSTDARSVAGVPNLEQAIGSRFRTEQGHNILYPNIGLSRTVGIDGKPSRIANIRHEARRQLLADPRIRHLASFQFLVDNDKVTLEASVVPVGFTSTRTIARTLT